MLHHRQLRRSSALRAATIADDFFLLLCAQRVIIPHHPFEKMMLSSVCVFLCCVCVQPAAHQHTPAEGGRCWEAEGSGQRVSWGWQPCGSRSDAPLSTGTRLRMQIHSAVNRSPFSE